MPRDLTGVELAVLLRRYDYVVTRQTGSHLRLSSTYKSEQHHVTIPRHSPLKVGTLSSILSDVASYLGTSKTPLAEELFGK
ncbi:MAG: type II toxin-antitoxin system HicA family toxin [Chloroflexi bacterium]|nr:type II toxin-antitoxin system HicA family toxin [Chloroflexota bacterium]